MASLKEVKSRAVSVENTRKITQARQMVASAQLHQAQGVNERAMQYYQGLEKLFDELQATIADYSSPLSEANHTGPVAVVILSSNSGMCGSFNTNMIKMLNHTDALYPNEEILYIPIGKKVREALQQAGYHTIGSDYDHLVGKPTFDDAAGLASLLMELYTTEKVKQVDIFYYHYKNAAIQEIEIKTFLPFTFKTNSPEPFDAYILEPSATEVMDQLLPMMLKADFYLTLTDQLTSEHGARMIAMQLATENAEDIQDELRMMYNKLRQQNITSELLDIIGSSFA